MSLRVIIKINIIIINPIIANEITVAIGIQRGEKIHHQDQDITCANFSTKKTIVQIKIDI